MHVLENGGEIHFTGDRDVFPADRIKMLDSGWIVAYNTRGYQKEILPPHKIDGIYTHTTAEEEGSEWFQ